MIVLSGASASGKTEVAKILEKKYGITKVITTTTRPVRINEKDGIDYFFVSNEKFLQMINEDRFVEYTQYNGNFYGSTKDQIQNNKCVVIDPAGLKAYSSINDDRIVTFLLECREETRYQRMIQRGDSKEDVSKRIINDKTAFDIANLCPIDFRIDSEAGDAEEVAKKVYDFYISRLQSIK